MSLEFSDSDILTGGQSAETTKESHEQYQERSRQTQAKLRRIQKDESKAKNDNDQLFRILLRFIQDPYYESLIPTISDLLSASTPSRLLIALIGLYYPDAAYFLAESTGQREKIQYLVSLVRYDEVTPFQDDRLDPSIRRWITEWVNLMEQFLLHENSSLIMLQKIENMLHSSGEMQIKKAIAEFFVFFFSSRNVSMDMPTAESYARFIQKNILKSIQKYLHHQDVDVVLLEDNNEIDNTTLF